jgi:hypothetical protein
MQGYQTGQRRDGTDELVTAPLPRQHPIVRLHDQHVDLGDPLGIRSEEVLLRSSEERARLPAGETFAWRDLGSRDSAGDRRCECRTVDAASRGSPVAHSRSADAAYGFLISEREMIPPRERVPPRRCRRLAYPKVIDPEAPPIRPERHVPNSIATIRRRFIVALVRCLSRCPCCAAPRKVPPAPPRRS